MYQRVTLTLTIDIRNDEGLSLTLQELSGLPDAVTGRVRLQSLKVSDMSDYEEGSGVPSSPVADWTSADEEVTERGDGEMRKIADDASEPFVSGFVSQELSATQPAGLTAQWPEMAGGEPSGLYPVEKSTETGPFRIRRARAGGSATLVVNEQPDE